MLEKWVNQNSGSLNLEGVTKVSEMLRAELEPLGFKVQWIDMSATARAGHIVATHKGNGRGKRLLLIGHLDTVFEPDSPFQRWERNGNQGIGPGAGDDKGGMAVMIAALRAMQKAGTLKNADIEVVLTGDEEDNGIPIELARRDLIAAGKRADAALDFEGLAQEDGKDMGSIARRSSGAWTVTVTARTGHSSGIFSANAGNGAIYELARIIDTFRRELREDKLTYNVGMIGGGATAKMDADRIRLEATGKTNIIPETAVARGDIRGLNREQIDRAKAKMQAIVAQPLSGATAKLEFDPDEYPPMAPTEGNRALLATAERRQPRHGAGSDGRAGSAEARRRRYQLRRAGRRRANRPRPGQRRRPCPRRACRHRVDLAPGQARRDPDEPAGGGEKVGLGDRFRRLAATINYMRGRLRGLNSPRAWSRAAPASCGSIVPFPGGCL